MTRLIAARLGLACSIAALSFAATSARAEEGVAFKNLMANMGLVSPEKDPIRYRERAPLVLPPKMALPTPAAPGSLATNDPQWPKDPDVEARRRRAADERMPVTSSEVRRMSDNNARLSIDEIRAGRTLKTSAVDPASHRGDNARDVLMLSPDQLRAGTKHSDDEDAKLAAGAEPERTSLTEPPAGMRKAASGGRIVATRSAPGVADQQQYDANPMNWLTRKFSSDND